MLNTWNELWSLNFESNLLFGPFTNITFAVTVAQFSLFYTIHHDILRTAFLPPTNEVCEGYVFTGVCLSTGGGSTWAGTPGQVHPLAGTPPGRYTPQAGTSPGQVHPPGRYTPRPQCMLGYGQQAGGTHPTGMHSCLR